MQDTEKNIIRNSLKSSENKNRTIAELHYFSGKDIMNRLFEINNQKEFVTQLAQEDFFWLIKKVGYEDCLPLLKWASEKQWEYLLDLEIWEKDRINWRPTFDWFTKLREAEINRLFNLLNRDGLELLIFYLSKCVKVMMQQEEEPIDIKEEYVSFDGIFYINVVEKNQRETIEAILKRMAIEDHVKYQNLLLSLSGILPAELEEQMYRMKNVRLSEHGFLPFDEAIAIFTPLDPKKLSIDSPGETPGLLLADINKNNVPLMPVFHMEELSLSVIGDVKISDDLLIDRIHLEFAGLCNQLIAAEGLASIEVDDLYRASRTAFGYINLAVEKRCGSNLSLAEDLLKHNSLLSLFRVGFGLVLKLRWEVEHWINNSWFYTHGLPFDFWDSEWGDILFGMVGKTPKHNIQLKKGDKYKNYETLDEIDNCRNILSCLMALDRLLERLNEHFTFEDIPLSDATFHPLLFNLWARRQLNLHPGFFSLSDEEFLSLFINLRGNEKTPPYQMPGAEDSFLLTLLAYVSDFDSNSISILEGTLSIIWQEFIEEFENVPMKNLEKRYSRYF